MLNDAVLLGQLLTILMQLISKQIEVPNILDKSKNDSAKIQLKFFIMSHIISCFIFFPYTFGDFGVGFFPQNCLEEIQLKRLMCSMLLWLSCIAIGPDKQIQIFLISVSNGMSKFRILMINS